MGKSIIRTQVYSLGIVAPSVVRNLNGCGALSSTEQFQIGFKVLPASRFFGTVARWSRN